MQSKERRGGSTPHTTFRTRPEDRALIKALMARLDLGQTGVIRLALRRLAQMEGVPPPEQTTETLEEERKNDALWNARQRAPGAAGTETSPASDER